MRDFLTKVACLCLLVASAAACAGPDDRNLIAAGPLAEDTVRFQLAVYYLPRPLADPRQALRRLLADENASLLYVDELPEKPSGPLVSARSLPDVTTSYAPPPAEMLQRFGHGLSSEQADALQASESVFVLDFAHPFDKSFDALRTAYDLVETVARETGGLIWDEETREVFTPDEWRRLRLADWTTGVPDISRHTTIHAYASGDYLRAITLGMKKFGLPDVAIEDAARSQSGSVGSLINLYCQSMAEERNVGDPADYSLRIEGIEHTGVREAQAARRMENSTGEASLTLVQGEWEEGDPHNRLIEISFDNYPGVDVHSRRHALLASIYGWRDSVINVDHDAELLAASERAVAQLPALRQAFASGLQPGEYIQVKAPFETPDGGNEWMWVEVTAWKGNRIRGILRNEPFNVPDLHAGQFVDVSQDELFDFIHVHADGRREGDETSAIIQAMQEAEQAR